MTQLDDRRVRPDALGALGQRPLLEDDGVQGVAQVGRPAELRELEPVGLGVDDLAGRHHLEPQGAAGVGEVGWGCDGRVGHLGAS